MPNQLGLLHGVVDSLPLIFPIGLTCAGMNLTLRETGIADLADILRVATLTHVFTKDELVCLQQDIEAQLSPNGDDDSMFTLLDGEKIVGFLHYGPLVISERGRMLFWIFTSPEVHSSGAASQLLTFMEGQLRNERARIVFIETSDTPEFLPARRFYLKHGYTLASVIPDYYADGVGKSVFSKSLSV